MTRRAAPHAERPQLLWRAALIESSGIVTAIAIGLAWRLLAP